ncbi:MAG: hypothetical protein ACI92N_004050, partial [Pseudomonadales bacterium]
MFCFKLHAKHKNHAQLAVAAVTSSQRTGLTRSAQRCVS